MKDGEFQTVNCVRRFAASRILFCVFFALFLAASAFAQLGGEITPGTSAAFEPQTGRVGRPVEYRVTVTGAQTSRTLPTPPVVPGLSLVYSNQTTSVQFLNGPAVQTTTFRYTATATREGELTVPGFEMAVGAQRVSVPSATLNIVAPLPGEAAYQPVRAVIDLPKRDFFLGETILARLLVIDTPDETPQFVANVSKTSGTVVFRTELRTRREQFVWEGKPASGLVMPLQITPIVEGETELNSEVSVHAQKLDPVGRRSGFAGQQLVMTQPATLRVLALPRVGRLPGFNGGIGRFTLGKPVLSATEIEAGEPLTLTLTLRGEGNIEGVPAPEFTETTDWQAYKPTSDFQRGEDPTQPSGTKIFTYTLVARREGKMGTPPLPMSYFDPAKREFVDITVPPVPVVVKASTAAPVAVAAQKETPPPAEEAAREREPVMTGLEEKPGRWLTSASPAFWKPWFLALQAAPPVLLLLLWAWRKRQEYVAAHPEFIIRRRARKAARKALAQARAAARRGNAPEFLLAGVGALCEAAAPLDSTRAGSLTRGEVLHALRDDERATLAARAIFDHAEATKYTAAAAEIPKPATLLPDLEHAVEKLSDKS